MKELTDLRKLSDEQLIKEKKSLKIMFLQTSKGLVDPKIQPDHRGKIRKRIARINTILGERQRRGVVKEEKRLK